MDKTLTKNQNQTSIEVRINHSILYNTTMFIIHVCYISQLSRRILWQKKTSPVLDE